MYYYGYFRNTDLKTDRLGNLYKVVIITNFNQKEFTVGGELLLSDSPFTVSWSGEEDNLFKGYKCSTATVGFYQENYNFEFNNTSENNVYVALLKLKDGRKEEEDLGILTDGDVYDIVWTGFATPNAYSQEYSSSLDYFELECQDALSTLKYKRYEEDEVTGHDYTRFSDIIIRYIGGLGSYKHIYTSSSLVLPTKDLGAIHEFLYIDEKNFFDEDGKSMTVLEVFNEMCTFLSLTMIPWGDSVFLIDYYSLEGGDYREIYSGKNDGYSLFSSKEKKDWIIGKNKQFSHFLNIGKEDFISSDTTLSLGSTYNKVSVLSDLYGLETILFNPDDDIYDYSTVFDTEGASYNGNVVTKSNTTSTEIQSTFKVKNDGGDEETKYQKTYYRFKNINNSLAKGGNFLNTLTTRWYNLDTTDQQDGTLVGLYGTTNQFNCTYANLRNYVGASYVEYSSNEVSSFDEKITGDLKTAIIMPLHNNKVFSSSDIQGLEYGQGWRNIWNSAGNTIIKTEDSVNQILMTINTKKIMLGKDDYIFIKGNFTFFNNNSLYVPVGTKDVDMHSTNCFVWCSLSDNKGNYWDGEKWKRRSEFIHPSLVDGEDTVLLNPKFRMPLKFTKGNRAFGTSIPITSYVDFGLSITENGYAIPAPIDEEGLVFPLELNFSIYRPWGVRYNDDVAEMALLEDFDITVVSKSSDSSFLNPDDNTNTSYTNTLNTKSLEEYPNIEVKITSHDGKQINRSNVYWFNYSPSSTTANPITASYEMGRIGYIHNKFTGQIGKPEELIIGNIAKQYSTPTASLELSLFNSLGTTPYSTLNYHFLGDRVFVVDGMSIDYAYDTVKLTLIERK